MSPKHPIRPYRASFHQRLAGKMLSKRPQKFATALAEVEQVLKRELLNATRQIEAFMAVEHYFSTGLLPALSTQRHTWPISPDLAIQLIKLIEENEYDLIIEFGSGVSTCIIAKALAYRSANRPETNAVRFVSFDHLQDYYQQTNADLKRLRLTDQVELKLAPLSTCCQQDEESYPFYDCEVFLAELGKQFANKNVLVFVDGPPAITGKIARYPALPVVQQHIHASRLDILLDDYIRDDEKEIARRWQEELTSSGLSYEAHALQLEKDAFYLRINNV